jgi:hypothetical protein
MGSTRRNDSKSFSIFRFSLKEDHRHQKVLASDLLLNSKINFVDPQIRSSLRLVPDKALCPALLKYFNAPPMTIFAKFEPKAA